MFWAELCLVGCGPIEFGFVSVIEMGGGCGSLDLDFEGEVVFFVFGLVVEGSLFVNVVDFLRI